MTLGPERVYTEVMKTFKCLVVEVNRDGCIDNFESVTVQAADVADLVNRVQRPASFVSRLWAIKKVWEDGVLVYEGWMKGA